MLRHPGRWCDRKVRRSNGRSPGCSITSITFRTSAQPQRAPSPRTYELRPGRHRERGTPATVCACQDIQAGQHLRHSERDIGLSSVRTTQAVLIFHPTKVGNGSPEVPQMTAFCNALQFEHLTNCWRQYSPFRKPTSRY